MVGPQLNKKLDELELWFKENPKLPAEIGLETFYKGFTELGIAHVNTKTDRRSIRLLDRILLRRFLKCMYNDVEETKRVIELNFSIRNKNPHIFLHRDPDEEAVKAIRDVVEMIPLPGLTPEGYKLLLFKLSDNDPKKMNSIIECKAFFMLADCRYSELDVEEPQTQQTEKPINDSQADETSDIETESLQDEFISNGEIQICDIGDYTLSHMARISFTALRMYMNFLQEAYPVRLRAMHIINCPPFLNKMVSIVKPFIHEDVYKMIHFHTEGMDSLYEKVPRHMLPDEYGGNAGDIKDIKKIWTDKLKVKRDYLMDVRQWKMDPAENSRRWYWF